MKRKIRYVKRITLPLTRECSNECVYCGFRKKDDSLLSLRQAEAVFNLAKKQGCSEIRITAGCLPHKKAHIEKSLAAFNVNSIVKYAFVVSNMAVNYGFLPVLDLGVVSFDELKLLQKTSVAINLMFECNKESRFKSFRDRDKYLEMVKNTGELKYPLNTGIILGLGESMDEIFDLISQIAEINNKYKHIQEFILQGYILNERTRLPMQRFLTLKELIEIYKFIIRKFEGVTVQVQPNTMDFWQEIISLGAASIGGVSEDIDYIVPRYKKDDLQALKKNFRKIKCVLREELPLSYDFYKKDFFHDDMKEIIETWINSNKFSFYKK